MPRWIPIRSRPWHIQCHRLSPKMPKTDLGLRVRVSLQHHPKRQRSSRLIVARRSRRVFWWYCIDPSRLSGSPISPLTRTPSWFPAEQVKQLDSGASPNAKVEASAPVRNSQVAPVLVSTRLSSEKLPIVQSDSTPAPTTSDPEKGGQDATTAGVPVPAELGPRVPDLQERVRKRRLLIIHTRLARVFTWILLLGFVILPSTFSRNPGENNRFGLNHIFNTSLYVPFLFFSLVYSNIDFHPIRFAIGYTCCLINVFAICWLWRLRWDDPEWLLTNLFSAGLINAFSGLITTFVNFCGVQGGAAGSSTKATLVLASLCTFIYGVLTVVYYRKREQTMRRRGSGASAMV